MRGGPRSGRSPRPCRRRPCTDTAPRSCSSRSRFPRASRPSPSSSVAWGNSRRGASARSSDTLRGVAEALIQDERLEWIVRGLDSTGWAAEVCDADWRLVWVAPQTRALIGSPDESDIGLGDHIIESRRRPAWQRMVSDEAQQDWIRQNVPQMLADDPGAKERLAA